MQKIFATFFFYFSYLPLDYYATKKCELQGSTVKKTGEREVAVTLEPQWPQSPVQ